MLPLCYRFGELGNDPESTRNRREVGSTVQDREGERHADLLIKSNISEEPQEVFDLLKAGGAEGIRTPDPHNAIVVLYQLSYDPSQKAGRTLGDSMALSIHSRSFIRRRAHLRFFGGDSV